MWIEVVKNIDGKGSKSILETLQNIDFRHWAMSWQTTDHRPNLACCLFLFFSIFVRPVSHINICNKISTTWSFKVQFVIIENTNFFKPKLSKMLSPIQKEFYSFHEFLFFIQSLMSIIMTITLYLIDSLPLFHLVLFLGFCLVFLFGTYSFIYSLCLFVSLYEVGQLCLLVFKKWPI